MISSLKCFPYPSCPLENLSIGLAAEGLDQEIEDLGSFSA